MMVSGGREIDMVGTAQHWETVWSEREPGSVSWFQASADLSLDLITGVTPDPASPIIDVGGGASPLAGQLVDHGYDDVTVLDLSEAALRAARERLGGRADRVRWVAADITRHEPGRTWATWHDRAVLHFLMDPGDVDRYVDTLTRALAPGGHAVVATFGPEGPITCSGLLVRRYDRHAMTALLAGRFEPLRFQHEIHRTPAGERQQFLYGLFRRTPRPS